MSSTFHLQNFGCRAAQADGAAIERELARRGWNFAGEGDADVVVLNTCTVTAAADADARAAIRRVRRENPSCKILVTGCYAQRAPEELAEMEGVEWVVGNSHKHQIADLLTKTTPRSFASVSRARPPHHAQKRRAPGTPGENAREPSVARNDSGSRVSNFFPLAGLSLKSEIRNPTSQITNRKSQILVDDIFAHTELLAAPVFDLGAGKERTRPNLKIQDGCNNRCSFCVIPSVRGRSRSLQRGEVLEQINALVEMGYREVVISGINLGRWGRELESRARFVDLVRAIVEETPLEKLRISSVEPMDWSDELIELVATHPRLARHAHVPLQSGSDNVLRRMHRKYRPWHYAERIEKIRAASAQAAIGADVMAGFPGESEQEFEESRRFIAALPLTYLHVFTFSARPGTGAAAMPNQVAPRVARERSRILHALSAEKNLRFRQSFVGGTLEAITLERRGEGFTEAITSNYLKLRLRGEHAPNRWLPVQIESLSSDGLQGKLAPRML